MIIITKFAKGQLSFFFIFCVKIESKHITDSCNLGDNIQDVQVGKKYYYKILNEESNDNRVYRKCRKIGETNVHYITLN